MDKNRINVDKRGYEIRPRVNYDFPIRGRPVCIESYEGRKFIHHWHKEPEFTVIIEGSLYYQVNDEIYHLTEGQGIFVNANALHSGWNMTSECLYAPTTFADWLMFDTEKSRIYKKYIEPVVSCKSFAGMVFDSKKSEDDKKVIELFSEVIKLIAEKSDGYELKCMANVCEALGIFMPKALDIINSIQGSKADKSIARTKSAIDYVEKHYAEQITLTDLAAATGLSTSEFCRSFKAIMGHTPMEYITNIRIRKSLPLLASREHSITAVAEMCGFSGSSYYSEVFKKQMGFTPSQYVKNKKMSN